MARRPLEAHLETVASVPKVDMHCTVRAHAGGITHTPPPTTHLNHQLPREEIADSWILVARRQVRRRTELKPVDRSTTVAANQGPMDIRAPVIEILSSPACRGKRAVVVQNER